jgi:hypothetical protein
MEKGQILFLSVKKTDDTFASISSASIVGAALTSAACCCCWKWICKGARRIYSDWYACMGSGDGGDILIKKRLVVDGMFHCGLHHPQIIVKVAKLFAILISKQVFLKTSFLFLILLLF